MAATDGVATTIVFGTTGFSANLIAVNGLSISRGTIDSTTMGTTGAMTFIPQTLYDAGEMTLTVEHSGADSVPINQPVETITIDWAGTGNTWAFDGFNTGYEPGAVIGERMESDIVVKASGEVTGLT